MSLHTLISSQSSRAVAALFGFVFTAVAAAPARAQTPVVFGDVITEPGFYFLAGNQTGSGDGVTIESNDVVLLLGRFTLRGNGTALGITTDGYSNVLIHGGRVTNFRIGVHIDNAEDVTVKDTRIDHCDRTGLFVLDSVDCSFLRLRCDSNRGDGVDAVDVDGCRFLSILAHENEGNGIRIGPHVAMAGEALGDGPDSTHNKIKLCWAAYNGLDGIRLFDADDNEVERNQCVGNDLAGIRLGSFFYDSDVVNAPGSQDNFVRSNWCVFNRVGIEVEWGSGSNTLTNNTALANSSRDLFDGNFESPCVNTWFLNFFLTKGGDGADCIF